MSFPRLESGFKMQDNVTKVSDMIYLVESRSRPGKFYSIDLRLGDCTCEDYSYNKVNKCAHIRAAEIKAGIYQ